MSELCKKADFNSVERYCNTYEYLLEHQGCLTKQDAAYLISTGFKKRGVRMAKTLYSCIMIPYDYELPMIGCKSSKSIGGYG